MATKSVKYVGPHPAVTLQPDPEVDNWVSVKHGETVDLPTAVANSLLEQGTWTAPKTTKKAPTKAPAKSAPAPAEADTDTAGDGTPQED